MEIKNAIVVVLVLLGLLLVAFYVKNSQSPELPSQNTSVEKLQCQDGTGKNQCSTSNTSYYCDANLQLVSRCNICGCQSGFDCRSGSCIDIQKELEPSKSIVFIKTRYTNGSGVITDYRNNTTTILTDKKIVRYADGLGDVFIIIDGAIYHPYNITVDRDGPLATLYVNGSIGKVATITIPTPGQDLIGIGTGGYSYGNTGDSTNGIQTTVVINQSNKGGGIFTVPGGELVGIGISDPGFEVQGPAGSVNNNTGQSQSNQSQWVPQTPACDCAVCDCG